MTELLNYLIENVDQFRRGRLPSLYSDFCRLQSTNPDGYTANISAWIVGLTKTAKAGLIPGCEHDTLSLKTGPDLLLALDSQELGQPAALGAVLDEGIRRGDFIPFDLFIGANTSTGRQGITSDPWSLARWLVRQLGYTRTSSSRLPEGRYVVTQNLEDVNQKIAGLINKRANRVESVLPLGEFAASVSKLLEKPEGISQRDLKILLTYLRRDKGMIWFDEQYQIVKVQTSDGKRPLIDEQDRNIASIKVLIQELQKQLSGISAKKDDAKKEAMAAVKAQNRNTALRYLRASKVQEALFDKRTETLLELENVYSKIEEAVSQVEVLAALKAGTNVLHGLNTEIGAADTVDLVLEDLRKEMADAEEVGSLLAQDSQFGGRFDAAEEIDAELDALESESRRADTEDHASLEIAKRLEALDHAPSAQPQIRATEKSQVFESQEDGVQNHSTGHSSMSVREGKGDDGTNLPMATESATS